MRHLVFRRARGAGRAEAAGRGCRRLLARLPRPGAAAGRGGGVGAHLIQRIRRIVTAISENRRRRLEPTASATWRRRPSSRSAQVAARSASRVSRRGSAEDATAVLDVASARDRYAEQRTALGLPHRPGAGDGSRVMMGRSRASTRAPDGRSAWHQPSRRCPGPTRSAGHCPSTGTCRTPDPRSNLRRRWPRSGRRCAIAARSTFRSCAARPACVVSATSLREGACTTCCRKSASWRICPWD